MRIMASIIAFEAVPLLNPKLLWAVVIVLWATIILVAIERSGYRRVVAPTSAAASSNDARAPSAATSAAGEHEWWASPLASEKESEIIRSATRLVSHLEPLPPHSNYEMLRQLRALKRVRGDPARALADVYSKHLLWRRQHVLWPADATANIETSSRLWPSATEHGRGEWARTRLHIGFNIGRSRGGHAVKLERIGASDISTICNEPGGAERLLTYYYSLIESVLLALNHESHASGSLLRLYAIFDLSKRTHTRHARGTRTWHRTSARDART